VDRFQLFARVVSNDPRESSEEGAAATMNLVAVIALDSEHRPTSARPSQASRTPSLATASGSAMAAFPAVAMSGNVL